jgi:hypothetical protein
MKYYFDTEFLEGAQSNRFMGIKIGETKPTIDLISIGIVAEDGREYYAASKDFNLKEAWNRHDLDYGHGLQRLNPPKKVYWIRENVLKPMFEELWHKNSHMENLHHVPYQFTYQNFNRLVKIYGKSNQQIAMEIKDFCGHWDGDSVVFRGSRPKYTTKPEFYAYYADYDWVAFAWLFGRMIDLPEGFPMYCRDLKQELDQKVLEIYPRDTMYHKEDVVDSFDTKLSWIKARPEYPKNNNEHNALSDAKWNMKLHHFINSLNPHV